MNLIQYRAMNLRVIAENPWIREPQYDESTTSYKWTKVSASFVCTFSPNATSAVPSPAGQPNNTANTPRFGGVENQLFPGAGPNTMPVNTDQAVRRFLEFPRGRLTVFAVSDGNANTILYDIFPSNYNPGVALTLPSQRDCNNGPFCKVDSIQEVAGERMWMIHVVFVFYVYEESLATTTSTAPIIVSNRWSVTADTNWQHLSVRIIEGMVHFRADKLIANDPNAAEAFRSQFASFTVPAGFQRTQVVCKTLPQGNVVAYRVVDEEQPLQQIAANTKVVRIEYVESTWMWKGSIGRAAAQAANGFSVGFNPLIPGDLQRRGLEQLQNLARSGLAQLPKRYKTVIARAWGNRLTGRNQLINVAMALAAGRMGGASIILPSTTETIVTYHASQLMSQVQMTIAWSFSDNIATTVITAGALATNVFFQGGNGGVGDLTFHNYIAQDDATQGINQTLPNVVQSPFPNDSQTRGSWAQAGAAADGNFFARLATQTLETLGNGPGAPT